MVHGGQKTNDMKSVQGCAWLNPSKQIGWFCVTNSQKGTKLEKMHFSNSKNVQKSQFSPSSIKKVLLKQMIKADVAHS